MMSFTRGDLCCTSVKLRLLIGLFSCGLVTNSVFSALAAPGQQVISGALKYSWRRWAYTVDIKISDPKGKFWLEISVEHFAEGQDYG